MSGPVTTKPGGITAECPFTECEATFDCSVQESWVTHSGRGMVMTLLLDSTDYEAHQLLHTEST